MASLTPDAVEGILHRTMTSDDGHRPVLQVTKVEPYTVTVGSPGRTFTRYKLWLSDGDRWACMTTSELEGATAGCLVRLSKYVLSNPSSGGVSIREMEHVRRTTSLISRLPHVAVCPP